MNFRTALPIGLPYEGKVVRNLLGGYLPREDLLLPGFRIDDPPHALAGAVQVRLRGLKQAVRVNTGLLASHRRHLSIWKVCGRHAAPRELAWAGNQFYVAARPGQPAIRGRTGLFRTDKL